MFLIHFQYKKYKSMYMSKTDMSKTLLVFFTFSVFFHDAWESYCKNGKTCQIKYQLDIICYWKVMYMERLTLSTRISVHRQK